MLLENLGLIHLARGSAEPALACYREARAICRERGDRPSEGLVLLGLGEALALAGQATEAADYFERSLPILREFRNLLGEAEALYRLGLAHRTLGRDRPARACWREAAMIYERLGAPEAEEVHALLETTTTTTA